MQENHDRLLGFVLKHYREGAFDTVKASETYTRSARTIPFWKYAALTAVAAAVILGIFLFRGGPSVSEYSAGGTSFLASLPDGTSVTLSPGSSLKYQERKGMRNAILDGTALFKVTHDESSPFVVEADGSSVKVLGTVFQVKESPDKVSVDVLEGKVLFSGQEEGVVLTAGMESVLDKGTLAPKIVENPLPNPTAWLSGEFRYEGAPLEIVLKELSEYFQMEFIALPEAAGRTLTGVFSTEDPEDIAEAISSALETRIFIRK